MTLGNSYGFEIYCLVCIDKNRPQRIYTNKFEWKYQIKERRRERERKEEKERESLTHAQIEWNFNPLTSKLPLQTIYDEQWNPLIFFVHRETIYGFL